MGEVSQDLCMQFMTIGSDADRKDKMFFHPIDDWLV